MEKEEKIVAILLTMTILSLAVAYMTYLPGEVTGNIPPLSDDSLIGEKVFVEGTVLNKKITFNGNHLIMDVSYSRGMITVFIPNNKGAEYIDKMVYIDDDVRIIGLLDEYEGEKELVVQKQSDVTPL